MPDIHFAVTGPTTWENDAVVARVLKKLAGKYGSSRLMMVVGDEVGLDKIAQTQAKHIGIHLVVVPTLHSSYYRDAPRLAQLNIIKVLTAVSVLGHSSDGSPIWRHGKPPFLVPFYWDLTENLQTRAMVVLCKRAGIHVQPVKKPKTVGVISAQAWYRMKQEKAQKKKRVKRAGK